MFIDKGSVGYEKLFKVLLHGDKKKVGKHWSPSRNTTLK